MVNDRYEDWQGTVRFRVVRDGKTVAVQQKPCRVEDWHANASDFRRAHSVACGRLPVRGRAGQSGRAVRGESAGFRGGSVGRVHRGSGRRQAGYGLIDAGYPPQNVTDGINWSQWRSPASDPQWIAVDLGKPTKSARVDLQWVPTDFARAYAIQTSLDNRQWSEVFHTDSGGGGLDRGASRRPALRSDRSAMGADAGQQAKQSLEGLSLMSSGYSGHSHRLGAPAH